MARRRSVNMSAKDTLQTLADLAIELPEPIADALEKLERLDSIKINMPAERPSDAMAQLLAGGDPLEIIAEQRRAVEAREIAEQALSLVGQAHSTLAHHRMNALLTEHADEIVEGPLRAKVARIVEEATPLAQELGPTFDPMSIASTDDKPSPKVVEQARSVAKLQAQLDDLIAAWSSTIRFQSVGMPDLPPRHGGHAVWMRPDLVSADVVGVWPRTSPARDNSRPGTRKVLEIAAQPEEAGYRLASLGELERILKDATERARVERERAEKQERRPRAMIV